MTEEERAKNQKAQEVFFESAFQTELIRHLNNNEDIRPVFILHKDSVSKRLANAGINQTTIYNYSFSEIGKILEVDAVIATNFQTTNMMEPGPAAAIAVGTFLLASMVGGVYVVPYTFYVNTNFSIVDVPSGNVVWEYRRGMGTSAGGTPFLLMQKLARKAARRNPY